MFKSKILVTMLLLAAMLSTLSLGCQSNQTQVKAWRFRSPQRVATDAKGYLYVVDKIVNHKIDHGAPGYHIKDIIIKISPSGRLVKLFELERQSVVDLAVSPQGSIYFLEYENNRATVVRIKATTNKIWKLKVPRLPGKTPRGLTVDYNDNIYIAYDDLESTDKTGRIVQLSQNGRSISQWRLSHPLHAAYGSLHNAKFITSDPASSAVYVSIYVPNAQDFEQGFERFTQAGKSVLLPLRLSRNAVSFAVDEDANLYLSDFPEPTRRLTPEGKVTGRFGKAPLSPASIAVTGGYLFGLSRQADKNVILKFSLGGKLLAVWRGVSTGGPMEAQ